jgi:hypothetical protein
MKKLILISSLLLSTSAFAGSNLLTLSPGVTTSNIMFNNVVAIQTEKPQIHKDMKSIKKGKPSNRLETSDEFPVDNPGEVGIIDGNLEDPGDGKLIDDNGDVVEITIDPREWKGIEEGGWVPELEPKCACIGNIHVPLEELEHVYPED